MEDMFSPHFFGDTLNKLPKMEKLFYLCWVLLDKAEKYQYSILVRNGWKRFLLE